MNEIELSHLIIGDSPLVRQVRSLVLKLAPTELPVLIQGPTGSGKELVAKALHQASGRIGKYVPFNVSAIADPLFEDAIFGHVKGAFTGAVRDSSGFLAEADKGTVFFDEIGELAYSLQPKLLRAIENRTYRPVGATSDRQSAFRLVSATNQPLSVLVSQERFRRDLAERLSTFIIEVPPLVGRREDIPALVEHFAAELAAHSYTPRSHFNADAIEALRAHDWPHNIRELRNVVHRVSVLARAPVISAGDVAKALEHGRLSPVGTFNIADQQRGELRALLEREGWNTARAALVLGVDRSTIYRRMQRLGIRTQR